MIDKIIITNHLDESVTMELRFPEKSGFLIRSIDGLGPTKANINTTQMFGIDGSIYNSYNVEERNIVITLDFLPKPTIEDSRQNSYKYFPLRRPIKIEIEADNRIAFTYGYVESNEPNIFSKKEGSIISIICPAAYLSDVYPLSTVFASITPAFEFPFSNESLVSPLLNFGNITMDTTKSIVYNGDAPVGVVITIHAIGSASGVSIINSRTLETIAINSTTLVAQTGEDIHEGDEIVISTVKGNKYAKLFRDSNEINILNTLGTNPAWFQLEKGDNIFAYTATSGLSNLEFRIDNEIAYEGI